VFFFRISTISTISLKLVVPTHPLAQYRGDYYSDSSHSKSPTQVNLDVQVTVTPPDQLHHLPMPLVERAGIAYPHTCTVDGQSTSIQRERNGHCTVLRPRLQWRSNETQLVKFEISQQPMVRFE
jgi:hypothetical protein